MLGPVVLPPFDNAGGRRPSQFESFHDGKAHHVCRRVALDIGDHLVLHLLRERLRLDDAKLVMTFQSRFGRAEWLKPYTDATVKALAARGVKNLAVITPGFSADCLETLEEIAGENAEYFHHAGGENFAAIPCLNDSEPGMRVIEAVVRRELQGWI